MEVLAAVTSAMVRTTATEHRRAAHHAPPVTNILNPSAHHFSSLVSQSHHGIDPDRAAGRDLVDGRRYGVQHGNEA
jgi:hypothetical protein